MVLEDYFDFTDYAKYGEIRIQGHRIWLHNVLDLHLDDGMDADQILDYYPSLSPEKIDACLRYYESNRAAVDEMMADHREYCEYNRRNPTLILRHTPDGPVLERVSRAGIPAGRELAETLGGIPAAATTALHGSGHR